MPINGVLHENKTLVTGCQEEKRRLFSTLPMAATCSHRGLGSTTPVPGFAG